MKTIRRSVVSSVCRRASGPWLQRVQPSRMYAAVHPRDTQLAEAASLVGEGDRLLVLGSVESAMDAYQCAHRIHPTANAAYGMANIYYQLGQVKDAEEKWREAVRLDPSHADALVNLGNVALSKAKSQQGSGQQNGGLTVVVEEAISCYERALKVRPSDGEVQYNLGIAYDFAGKPEQALQMYQQARGYFAAAGEHKVVQRLDMLLRNARVHATKKKKQ